MTRSYAKTGHYDSAKPRKNYHLLVGYRVREVVFDKSLRATGVNIQAREGSGANVSFVEANKEVVLAAGSFGSPVLLQRSGVGPKTLLESAGVEVKFELPGVGMNLQDHAASILIYNCEYCRFILEHRCNITWRPCPLSHEPLWEFTTQHKTVVAQRG